MVLRVIEGPRLAEVPVSDRIQHVPFKCPTGGRGVVKHLFGGPVKKNGQRVRFISCDLCKERAQAEVSKMGLVPMCLCQGYDLARSDIWRRVPGIGVGGSAVFLVMGSVIIDQEITYTPLIMRCDGVTQISPLSYLDARKVDGGKLPSLIPNWWIPTITA